MYGLTRATTTLIAAGVAGLLIWIATQIGNGHMGGYWARIGLVAAAGFVMALSQLLGGWTKWGVPRVSIPVLLTAFVPVAIVVLWEILAAEPSHAWLHNHILAWTRDIHVSGLVTDMTHFIPALAFGGGLVFGFSFDTSGPRRREAVAGAAAGAAGAGPRRGRRARATRDADEPLTAERRATAREAPSTREGEPVRGTTDASARRAEPVMAPAPARDDAPTRSGDDQ
jgi:hypothetical protein